MPAQPIAIRSTGLVTSVGLSAPASCAAIRAKISNPTLTRFLGSDGEWIMAHQVLLAQPWRGLTKLAKMAAMAIAECLAGISREEWSNIPVLLCVAEQRRPGRFDGLDDQLSSDIQCELDMSFAPYSTLIASGRVSIGIALIEARRLIHEVGIDRVVIAATDSLLTGATLSYYQLNDRLLSTGNSNGFMPGEGAGALLMEKPKGCSELVCSGIGLGVEEANVDSEEPLRADGLTQAIRNALEDAGREIHDLDFRIADLSGEQYYFKEATLALGRILRRHKEQFDIWHPAECIGESGAAAGIAALALAEAARRNGYAGGPMMLLHFANDDGQRAAAILRADGEG